MKNKEKILNPYGTNGICSYEYKLINGINQYIQIRGEKRDNPVCFITGAEDVNCPGELVEEIMDSIEAPEKEYHRILDASHMCFYDNAEEFEKIIFSYVR